MADPIPVFAARVTGGRLVFGQPLAWVRHLARHEGAFVDVSMHKRTAKMSNQQRRWIRGIAEPMIAEALGYDRHDRDELHYWLLMECFGTREFRGRVIANVPHSSDLPVPIASEFMEWLVRWAPENCNGLVVPLPNEIDMTNVEEWA
jgi:hypothetical protein